jgi:hemoglobin-like flavoprotein
VLLFNKYSEENDISTNELNKIRESWKKAEGKIDKLGAIFYARLFETTPATKTLFDNISIEKQASKLLGIVNNLIKLADISNGTISTEKREVIVKSLWQLGARHIHYGVQSEVFLQSLAQALLWSMGQSDILGTHFSEYSAVWTKAFRFATAVMSKGMRDKLKGKEFDYSKINQTHCVIL